MSTKIKGILPVLHTPLDMDGQVDEVALRKIVEFLVLVNPCLIQDHLAYHNMKQKYFVEDFRKSEMLACSHLKQRCYDLGVLRGSCRVNKCQIQYDLINILNSVWPGQLIS